MEQYKDFWIAGEARPGPLYTQYYNPSGDVCYQRPDNSIVVLAKFTLEFFKFDDCGVAELFGLETRVDRFQLEPERSADLHAMGVNIFFKAQQISLKMRETVFAKQADIASKHPGRAGGHLDSRAAV